VRHGDFEYRFLHDRVQQAAYMLVPKELNRRVHLEVAQFLLAKAETQGADQTVVRLCLSSYAQLVMVICSSYRLQQCFDVFDVAYHFNKAAELITDPEQRLLVARLNLRAAVKARKSMGTPSVVCVCVCVCVCDLTPVSTYAAYDMAQRATVHGIAMLPADCWDSQHDLAFQLHIGTPSPLPFSMKSDHGLTWGQTQSAHRTNIYASKWTSPTSSSKRSWHTPRTHGRLSRSSCNATKFPYV
jgi:hypothetical protein